MTSTTVRTGDCPRCQGDTVTRRDSAPWCPRCEWNLDRFEPGSGPGRRRGVFGWRPLDRMHHRLAFRMTGQQYADLRDEPLDTRGGAAARVVTTVVGVLVLVMALAFLALGVWVLVARPIAFSWVVGPLLILVAYVLRPRLGRIARLRQDAREVSTVTAPGLFALIGQVAAALGAPEPHLVLLTPDFAASSRAAGLARRRVLLIGAPLWGALEPQERVALIAHELAHFVNGDVRQDLVAGLALETFGEVAELLRPAPQRRGPIRRNRLVNAVANVVTTILLGVLSRFFLVLHLALRWVGMRDQQRAEYYADEAAARVAGSSAVAGLLEKLLLLDVIETVVRREARGGGGAAAWREAARVAHANQAADLPLLGQLDRRRSSSMFAAEPPAGLRVAMIAHRSAQPGVVELTEQAEAAMDLELAGDYEAMRREIVHWE